MGDGANKKSKNRQNEAKENADSSSPLFASLRGGRLLGMTTLPFFRKVVKKRRKIKKPAEGRLLGMTTPPFFRKVVKKRRKIKKPAEGRLLGMTTPRFAEDAQSSAGLKAAATKAKAD